MAITAANLLTDGSIGNSTGYTTASISPGADKLILVAVYSYLGGLPDQPTLSGNGLTYVAVDSKGFPTGAENRRISLFRAMGASPSTGAISISFGAQTQAGCMWSIVEVSGMDTSGTNGSGAVAQHVTNDTTSTSLTVTLGAFSSAANATFGCFGGRASSSISPGAGFTELGEVDLNDIGLRNALQTEFRADNDTTVDASGDAGTTAMGGVAIEIVAASSPGWASSWRPWITQWLPWMALALSLLLGCAIPRLEDAGKVNDAGSCQILTLPGSCGDIPALEREWESALPCNTCVSYRCDCDTRWFCKFCGEKLLDGYYHPEAWGCTCSPGAWCQDRSSAR